MAYAIRDGVPYVNDKAFPWASKVIVSDAADFPRRHFWLTFENGWTLSVTFGAGTYCENHMNGFSNEFIEEPDHAEAWGWWGTGDGDKYWALDDGEPRGWISSDDMLVLIADMQTWPSRVPA